MDGQRHAPAALPPGKTRYPLYRRLGGLQGRSGRVRYILPTPGLDPRTVQPVASRYADWAVPAHHIRSPDRPARCQSLCRLSCRGPPHSIKNGYFNCRFNGRQARSQCTAHRQRTAEQSIWFCDKERNTMAVCKMRPFQLIVSLISEWLNPSDVSAAKHLAREKRTRFHRENRCEENNS